MKPLLAVSGAVDDLTELAAVCNEAAVANYGPETDIILTPVETEEELRQFEAGSLVLYRKPARRRGNIITYAHDGEEVRLEQLTLDTERADTSAG